MSDARIRMSAIVVAVVATLAGATTAVAQPPGTRSGEVVPRDVREMYERGLKYLARTQSEAGDWPNSFGEQGPGGTGLALMVFLASGEDPNFGLYAGNVRKALRNIISALDVNTGYFGQSMYHQGFGMLALAEAYGAVDEHGLWTDGKKHLTIGQALELAVRGAITSQKKNSSHGWRYSPEGGDADTSVSGSVLVGLLAARNAGIEVPDEAIDQAVAYFKSMTAANGDVAYTGGIAGGFGESTARTAIASLVYSVARRKDLPEFKAAFASLRAKVEGAPPFYAEYTRYYQAQAYFQGDVALWEKWNTLLIRQLKQSQLPDGSFPGQTGPVVGTSMTLLALALNFRFLPIYER